MDSESRAASDLESSFVLVRDASSQSISEKSKIPSQLFHPSHKIDYKVGSTPYYAHDWASHNTGGIGIRGRHFIDSYGRACGLRGVNLSGACKTPANNDYLGFPDNYRNVTFVGRPFPLEEAHEHFPRLRRWGLTFIRFLVTWEAVEHEGLGIYDKDYLSYLRSLLSLLPRYGIIAFVSMHQDVWSRFSGGSGAPAWTLTAVGFDLHNLEETGAAWLKGVKGGGHIETERGIWPCGYQKLASSTMSTCFWGGDTFLPKLNIDDVPVQQYLQSAFLGAWEQVARAVGDLDGVVGFEMINEPHRGYIELPSLYEFDYNTDLHLAYIPSVIQSLSLGAGHPTLVPHYTRSFPFPTSLTSREILNKNGIVVWRPDGPSEGKCIWEMHGVWGWDTNKSEAVVLREHYFMRHPTTDDKIDWYTDLYFPFVQKWAERIRRVVGKEKLIFTEAIPNEFCPESWTPNRRPYNMVYAPHWYDLKALFEKAYGQVSVNVQGLSRGMFLPKALYWGHRGARDNYSLQIRNIVNAADEALGEVPIIVGECGIPMDMNRKEAMKTNDWLWQSRMMDAMITALERSLVGFTLWNYNADNDDDSGDHWNGENFSWFSRSRAIPSDFLLYEQASASLDQGGRILRSIVRPYPAKVAGIPVLFDYEMNSGRFTLEWIQPPTEAGGSAASRSHQLTARESEIFIPSLITVGRKVKVEGLDGSYVFDESRQTLFILPTITETKCRHRIVVSLDPPLEAEFDVNDFWSDFGSRIISVFIVLLAILAYVLFGR